MQLLYILCIYGVVGVTAVGVFLWGKPEGNSIFDRLYRLFCQHLPHYVKLFLGKLCGQRAPDALDWCWNYVCFTSNPIIQVFYFCIIVGGYAAFVIYGYPFIPGAHLAAYHKYFGFVVFAMCLLVWVKASFTDPGTVTAENVDALLEYYEFDEQLFTSIECRTCKTIKPARSKHCSLCNICVVKFDHHCIWINNCVGVGNHRYFLAFLFMHFVICLYGTALGGTIIYTMITEKKLLEATFVDPVTRERFTATYLIVFQYLLATEGMLLFITILCAIMGLVLLGFYFWHLNLVRMGTTTNELSKWKYLKYCLKREGEEGIAQLKQLVNIYNRGICANFSEVIWPLECRKMGKAPSEKSKGSKQENSAKASENGTEKTSKSSKGSKKKN